MVNTLKEKLLNLMHSEMKAMIVLIIFFFLMLFLLLLIFVCILMLGFIVHRSFWQHLYKSKRERQVVKSSKAQNEL